MVLLRLRGWWRLKFGFCPLCCSSPPAPYCKVCLGSHFYGHQSTVAQREAWRRLYRQHLDNTRRRK